MSSGDLPLGAGDQSGAPTDDDPAATLARVNALKQVADLGGFPHDPEWDRLEADAWERLGGRPSGEAAPPITPLPGSPPTAPGLDDPFLAIAQVHAARQVADELGVAPNPEWDATEERARRQLAGRDESPGETPP